MSIGLTFRPLRFEVLGSGSGSRWNVVASWYICLLVKRTDKIESGGTKLRMCPMISLGISTSVMAGGADSGCDPKSASGCAINSASTNMIISDNDSRNMLIMSIVVIVTNVVCVV